jgi:O-antigen/teichoic acid export membrane protein
MAAILGITLLAWQLPSLFKDMPTELHQDARLALLWLGGSLAVALPFNVFGGIFIGLQRYDIPAWIIGTSKLLGGLFVVLIAQSSENIATMGVVMGISNLLTGLWLYFAYRRIAGDIKVSSQKVSKRSAIEISNYCSGLLVWSMGMILVSGLDTAIIGYFDYQSVVYYTLAASVTTFIIGIQSSIFSTILPNAAAIAARGDQEGLGKLLISSTRYATITLILTSLPLILGGKWLLTLWVGEDYAVNTVLLLQLLVIANFIRQLGAPYSTIILAAGEQRLIVLSPMLEGIVNLFASILLVMKIGVVGVAVGTIIGGIVSILFHLFYNLPRTKSIKMDNSYSLATSILKPLISIVPAIAVFMLSLFNESQNIGTKYFGLALLFAGYLSSAISIYLFAIDTNEKKQFIYFLRKMIKKYS